VATSPLEGGRGRLESRPGRLSALLAISICGVTNAEIKWHVAGHHAYSNSLQFARTAFEAHHEFPKQ
jgi:hypothetical protein